jgi:hypothetical protein
VKAPSPKPLPQTKLHIPTSKLIATTRDYTGSTSGRTIAFAIVLIALCAGLAFLMKIEISRLLATRRFGGR